MVYLERESFLRHLVYSIFFTSLPQVLQSSNQRETNNENEIIDVGPARITEREEENKMQDQNDDDNSKLQMVKVKGKQRRPLPTQASEEEDDDQGKLIGNNAGQHILSFEHSLHQITKKILSWT